MQAARRREPPHRRLAKRAGRERVDAAERQPGRRSRRGSPGPGATAPPRVRRRGRPDAPPRRRSTPARRTPASTVRAGPGRRRATGCPSSRRPSRRVVAVSHQSPFQANGVASAISSPLSSTRSSVQRNGKRIGAVELERSILPALRHHPDLRRRGGRRRDRRGDRAAPARRAASPDRRPSSSGEDGNDALAGRVGEFFAEDVVDAALFEHERVGEIAAAIVARASASRGRRAGRGRRTAPRPARARRTPTRQWPSRTTSRRSRRSISPASVAAAKRDERRAAAPRRRREAAAASPRPRAASWTISAASASATAARPATSRSRPRQRRQRARRRRAARRRSIAPVRSTARGRRAAPRRARRRPPRRRRAGRSRRARARPSRSGRRRGRRRRRPARSTRRAARGRARPAASARCDHVLERSRSVAVEGGGAPRRARTSTSTRWPSAASRSASVRCQRQQAALRQQQADGRHRRRSRKRPLERAEFQRAANSARSRGTMTVSAARPRTLLFYAPALLDGGAERVWARLASAFAARGDAVDFAVDFEATQSAPFLSRDVALEVLPRGHVQLDARAGAPDRRAPPRRDPVGARRRQSQACDRRDAGWTPRSRHPRLSRLQRKRAAAAEPHRLSPDAAPLPPVRGDGRGVGGVAPRSHRPLRRS